MLCGRGIGRSEAIRQHEEKPTQHDDGHAEVAGGRDHVAIVGVPQDAFSRDPHQSGDHELQQGGSHECDASP
jgi:hypothetical protein